MKALFCFLVMGLSLNFKAHGESTFEPRLENFNLKEQLDFEKQMDGERILPEWEDFTLATDITIWKYWPDTSGYYHGPGFWVDSYLEYRPLESLSINGKFIFANGSSSYGYNAASGIKPFLGVTWEPQFAAPDLKMLFRFFDLDRSTLGAGLFFQDREMSGAFFHLQKANWVFNIRLPGTSVLNVTGDLYSIESYFKTGLGEMGIHSFFIEELAKLEPIGTSGALDLVFYDVDPVTSFFWRSSGTSFLYDFELANRQDQWAGMLGLGYAYKNDCVFCIETKVQVRHYDRRIVGAMGGNAALEYLPYSLHVRDYHNAINILRQEGKAQSASLNLNMRWNLSEKYFVESLNEVGTIKYNRFSVEDQFYWYKQSFGYCPYKNRSRSCVKFFVANKVLKINGLERTFFQDPDVHKRADIFGFEAQVML